MKLKYLLLPTALFLFFTFLTSNVSAATFTVTKTAGTTKEANTIAIVTEKGGYYSLVSGY